MSTHLYLIAHQSLRRYSFTNIRLFLQIQIQPWYSLKIFFGQKTYHAIIRSYHIKEALIFPFGIFNFCASVISEVSSIKSIMSIEFHFYFDTIILPLTTYRPTRCLIPLFYFHSNKRAYIFRFMLVTSCISFLFLL